MEHEEYLTMYEKWVAAMKASAAVSIDIETSSDVPLKCIGCGIDLCEVCGRCEQINCYLYHRIVTSKAELVELRHLTAKTQKARGYVAIADVLNVPAPFKVFVDPDDIDIVIKNMYLGRALFVRPCPVRPRHGFVESRTISVARTREAIAADLRQIFAEARNADPESELLVVPAIESSHNVILTPTKMAIGVGNDGATAGKQSTLFPLTGVPFLELNDEVITKAGVDIAKEDPYIEVVIRNGAQTTFYGSNYASDIYCTQLRAGAKIAPTVDKDFIPDRMVVEKIIEASGDLLEWEAQVKDITPGTVVVHQGGTLISHYGVHCIFHNVPILTTRIPEIGETLFPTARPQMPTPEAVLKGLAIGATQIWLGDRYATNLDALSISCSQAAALLLTVSHNAAALGGDHGYWIGIAASLMMRLGMAASHGEARHRDPYKHGLDRAYVYSLALNDFFVARETLGIAQWRFKNINWESGFGGSKWAKCTDSIFKLDAAAKALINDPSDENVAALVTVLHGAINQAHNGGWWLNKFVRAEIFDYACAQSIYSLCTAAPAILNIAGMKVDGDLVQSTLVDWKALDEIKVIKPEDAPTPETDENYASEDCTCDVCTGKSAGLESESEVAEAEVPEVNTDNVMNVNGKVQFSEDTVITEAQAVFDSKSVHIQCRTEDMQEGQYVSFNAKFHEHLGSVEFSQIKQQSQVPSMSGSGKMYYKILPVHVKDHKGNGARWIFYMYDPDKAWKGAPWVIWNIKDWKQEFDV